MPQNKLILLAIDSADADLVLQWAAAGFLPNIAKLLREGVSAPVETPAGVLEGAIWPTILTSTSAATHGMYAYRQLALGTYDTPIAMMADQLAMPPFWAYVGKSGKRVAVIDAPFAKPVKKLNGIQVTNWGGHDLWCHPRSSWPAGLIDDLTERFGDYPVPHCDDVVISSGDYEGLRNGLMEAVRKKTALLRHCLAMEEWDFFFGVYSESHCAGHQFWHFMDPSHPRYTPDAPDTMRHCIRDIYAAIDAGIGELLACLAPDTHALLLLSHGMGPYYHASHLLEEIINRLEANEVGAAGTTAMIDEDDNFKNTLWAGRRVIPHALREKIKKQMPRDWLKTLWRWTHPQRRPAHPWSNKRVFQLPESNMTGLLRINLKGREPNSVVQPGAEYERLCDRVIDELLALENVDTGRKAVQWVVRARELYQGPHLDVLPDLFVEWDHTAPLMRVRSPQIGTIEGVFGARRTGSHRPGGLWLGSGPTFASGKIDEVNTVDLAPTILDFFGVTAPPAYEGRSRLDRLTDKARTQAA
jgi:predicted AlkP superfamily phosphohydrolase/phosphomutase